MSSTQEGSSAATSSKTKKLDVKRRSWTQLEECSLITALKEIAADPKYRADNGFKAGYLVRLEELIQASCPGTDLKAMPHITSKLSTWKKNYCSLVGMFSRSGVGFSSRGNHMIDCEEEQWQQIVKVDPNARSMRHKPWPYYDDWVEIFGRDRANGDNAEDVGEAFIDEQPTPDFGVDDNQELHEENEVNDASTNQVSQSCKVDVSNHKTSRSKKKARMNDDIQGVCEMLAVMNEATNARLDHLASRIGFDYDLSKARQETFDQLGAIPGLSIADRYKLCEIVAMNDKRLDIWRAFTIEARIGYVENVLLQLIHP